MTLQQLQYLVALAESNSINQAAQNLFVSQSGISKAIKQLESELGFPLLERSSRGITFTSRGTEFLHDAYSLIKQFHTLQDHYLQTEPQGMITMSITSRYYIFVAKAVAKMANLLKEHNYFIRLQEGKVSDIIQDVAARRSQLGFISYYDTNAEFIQHELERFNRALPALLLWHARIQKRQRHIVDRRHFGQQVKALEYKAQQLIAHLRQLIGGRAVQILARQ